jgi:hypothetical protein
MSKIKQSTLTSFCCELGALFSVADTMAFSIAKNAVLFLGHNGTAMFRH